MNAKFLCGGICSLIACGLLGTATANASLVGPGETVTFTDIQDFVVPPGTLLAQSTKTFTIDFKDENGDLLESGDGTLHSQVLRRDDGKLTFVYNFEVLGPGGGGPIGEEGGDAKVSAFGGFSTDVSGIFQHGGSPFPVISRSNDGDTITFGGAGGGAPTASAPLIVIGTDATKFDAKGHASITGIDEFGGEVVHTIGSGTADVSGTFQPIRDGGPVTVPLPPAAYPGLGMVGLVVGATLRRRRLRTI